MCYKTQACCFPWVKLVVGNDKLVVQAWSIIFTKIKGKTNCLSFKFDMLQKLVNH